MNSSHNMLNPSSYFQINSYPLYVPSELSSFNPISVQSNDKMTTNDYLSDYSDNPSIHLSNACTDTRSHSILNQSNMEGSSTSYDRYNTNSSFSSLLIPRGDRCLICTDRASGIHFGVLTCEACKAFFRRNSLLLYSIPQPCSPIRCEINTKNRNNCPGCRFDKCKRFGMDRENVIYGKPSKQQMHLSFHENSFFERCTNLLHDLRKRFQAIQSIHQTSLMNSFEIKQQIDQFAQILLQFFYERTSSCQNIKASDIIHRIFILIFDSYKINLVSDDTLVESISLQMILSLWLFVYYYETFLLKQKISSENLTLLIRLLEMELMQVNQNYAMDQNKTKFFKINFINSFTLFADHLQDIVEEK